MPIEQDLIAEAREFLIAKDDYSPEFIDDYSPLFAEHAKQCLSRREAEIAARLREIADTRELIYVKNGLRSFITENFITELEGTFARQNPVIAEEAYREGRTDERKDIADKINALGINRDFSGDWKHGYYQCRSDVMRALSTELEQTSEPASGGGE